MVSVLIGDLQGSRKGTVEEKGKGEAILRLSLLVLKLPQPSELLDIQRESHTKKAGLSSHSLSPNQLHILLCFHSNQSLQAAFLLRPDVPPLEAGVQRGVGARAE